MSTTAGFVQVTGWLTVSLLVLLLIRAVIGGTLKVYPYFYSYASLVLVRTAVGISVKWSAGAYRTFYWAGEWMSLLLGLGVTWEIYRKVLARYPGVRRLAFMLLSLIFVLVGLVSAAGQGEGPFSVLALERDVRTVQAIVLLILFALVAYYAVPLGKNARGIAIGYIFGVAISVFNLGLANFAGAGYYWLWNRSRALQFTLTLLIWCATLWKYQPEPVPSNEDVEHDYEWVSAQAARALVRLRTHLMHPDGS
jgi:hypothetical protein